MGRRYRLELPQFWQRNCENIRNTGRFGYNHLANLILAPPPPLSARHLQ